MQFILTTSDECVLITSDKFVNNDFKREHSNILLVYFFTYNTDSESKNSAMIK